MSVLLDWLVPRHLQVWSESHLDQANRPAGPTTDLWLARSCQHSSHQWRKWLQVGDIRGLERALSNAFRHQTCFSQLLAISDTKHVNPQSQSSVDERKPGKYARHGEPNGNVVSLAHATDVQQHTESVWNAIYDGSESPIIPSRASCT